MSPSKSNNNRHSNKHGEDAVRQANVLTSCYLVDATAALKGLHYCTTSLTGMLLPSIPFSLALSVPARPRKKEPR